MNIAEAKKEFRKLVRTALEDKRFRDIVEQELRRWRRLEDVKLQKGIIRTKDRIIGPGNHEALKQVMRKPKTKKKPLGQIDPRLLFIC
jgi:hypothetical protein